MINCFFSRQSIENEIFKPIRQWLCTGDNLKKARKNKYIPLQEKLGEILDNYLKSVSNELNQYAEKCLNLITKRIIENKYNFRFTLSPEFNLEKGAIVAIDASLALSYFLFFTGGILLGGVTGAITGEGFLSQFSWADFLGIALPLIPHLSAYILGVAGAILGGILGLIARSLGGDEIRREKLIEKISTYIEKTLIQGLKEKTQVELEEKK